MLKSSPGAVFQPRGFPNMKTSRLFHLLITAIATAACLTPIAASAQADDTTVRHVAGRIPVQGVGREMSADRPTNTNSQPRISRVSSQGQSLEAAGHSAGSGHPRHLFSEREDWLCRRRSRSGLENNRWRRTLEGSPELELSVVLVRRESPQCKRCRHFRLLRFLDIRGHHPLEPRWRRHLDE